jgi:hypothetical protein
VLIATLENEFAVLTPVATLQLEPKLVDVHIPLDTFTAYWPDDESASAPIVTDVARDT